MNILIVDDERLYCKLVKDYFEQEGWTVFTAENGQDALEQLGAEKIDAVVSDIYMPIMNGVQFRDKVRENPKYLNLPFLFVSAYNDNYTLNAIKYPKIEALLEKTKPLSEVKAWIEHLIKPIGLRSTLPSPRRNISDRRVTKRDPNSWKL
jgi:two-component system, response regulator